MSKVLKNIHTIMCAEPSTAAYPGSVGWTGVKLGTITGDGVTIAEGQPKVEYLKQAGSSVPVDTNTESGDPISFTGACYVEVGAELTNMKGGTLGADGWEAGDEIHSPLKSFVLSTKDTSKKILIPNGTLVGWFTGKLADNGSALINFQIIPNYASEEISSFKITKS